MYVDERDSLFREEIISFLEEKGYVISKTELRSRQEIIDYSLFTFVCPVKSPVQNAQNEIA